MRRSALHTAKAISLSLLLGCFAACSVAANALGPSLYDWKISAISDEQTGAFKHCGAVSPLQEGEIFLAFYISRDFHLGMGVATPTWQLEPGSRYPISYQIDNSSLFTAEAVAADYEMASARLAGSSALFELFRKGRLLKVRVAGREFRLSLHNSSKALTALRNCAQRNVLADSQREVSNPFVAPGATQTKRAANTAQLQAEAAAVTANTLASSGLRAIKLADTILPEFEIFHAIWWAEGVSGWTIIAEGDTVDTLANTMIAGTSTECTGKFASMKFPSAKASAVRVKTICEPTGERPHAIYTSIVERKKGGVYLFAVQERKRGNDAGILEDAGARVFEAAAQLAH